ncbi:kynureninase-like, partial [Pollicipes pollicipes]|uniref:kynureninase-like n=1 Tax=Pollicipes pollicipes TaxID=41117 RepID=UPI001884F08C
MHPASSSSDRDGKVPGDVPCDPTTTLSCLATMWQCEVTSEQMAANLDKHDSLAAFRSQFEIPKMKTKPGVDLSAVNPEDDIIYMNGNSLGLKPKKTDEYCSKMLQQWGEWGHQTHFMGVLPAAKCDLEVNGSHARLVGAHPDEVAVMNGLTVNLHLLLIAFYHPTPLRHKVLIEEKAFPSDKYAVGSQVRRRGYDPSNSVIQLRRRPGEDVFRTEDVLDLIARHGHEIAVILIGGVHYFTGQKFDMEAITKAGHAAGCVVGFDLAHAIGNVKLELHKWNVDFACWCTYKYLNSGPGCIAGAFVHNQHMLSHLPLLHGWWGNKAETRFHMRDSIDASVGVNSLKLCNPPQMLVAMNRASMDIFDQVSMDQLLEKQTLLTGYLELLAARRLPEACQMTPRDPHQRGCQLSFRFPDL